MKRDRNRLRHLATIGIATAALLTAWAADAQDTTPPTITSIVRQTPATQTVGTTSVVFTVTFSEAVTGVSGSWFTVTPINGGNSTGAGTSVTGGPTVYQVAVNLASGTGEFRLDMITPTSTTTTFASGFSLPIGLAFDSAGTLYVANEGNNTVSKVTTNGTVSTFASGFSNPRALAFDSAGTLYVANEDNNTVSKVTTNGTVSPFASGFRGPCALAFDSAGTLYVANFFYGAFLGTVSQVTTNGTVSTFASGFEGATGLAFDSAGTLYVANYDNGTVSKVTTNGTVSTFASGFIFPFGLAFDSAGTLYVANYFDEASYSGDTVSKVTTNGTVSTLASGFSGPTGLAFDSAGNLYVANSGNNNVCKITIFAIKDLAGNAITGLPYTSGASYIYAPAVAPVISLSTNTAFYTLGDAPVLLDPLAGCAAGGAAFNDGVLNVTLVSNAEPRDVLGVFDQGTAPGEIGVSPSQITFGGSTIASFSGISTGATSMTFTFNANANASGVQQLLRNLTYRTLTNRPTTFTRTVQLIVTAGGMTSTPVALTLELNHRPTAGGDRIATGTNLPVFISYARMLANDSDRDGDAFAMLPINTNTASGGTLVVETNGVTFTPLGSFATAGSFAYQLQDVRGGLTTGGVIVEVLSAGQLFIEDLPGDATASSNSLTLAVMDIPNRTYRIEASDDLSLWTQIGTLLTPANGLARYWDADAINHTNRFYRTLYP
ncbi:MAG: hypothetical protein EXS35_08920 [Pedosphaera sp.]|nr:hypothetical protein [Pedosphaera sp.]